jgi:hypothetical protein
MVESQIANLTSNLSFDHNLCFKCSNGMCETISDILVPRAFEWYKECFNPMSFNPCNYSLKIQKSIETPTPKVEAHLGVCGFIPSHPLGNMKCDFQISFLACTFASPCLKCKPKVRVTTMFMYSAKWLSSYS